MYKASRLVEEHWKLLDTVLEAFGVFIVFWKLLKSFWSTSVVFRRFLDKLKSILKVLD